jgi:hypothetical protein
MYPEDWSFGEKFRRNNFRILQNYNTAPESKYIKHVNRQRCQNPEQRRLDATEFIPAVGNWRASKHKRESKITGHLKKTLEKRKQQRSVRQG